MSTETRRPRAQALADLSDFDALVRPGETCERWIVCGSIRRQKETVGDVDIVAIPKLETVTTPDGMFGETKTEIVNSLWKAVDEAVASGKFRKAVKKTTAGERTKWGAVSRAIEFRGFTYEIQLADSDNVALWMAVRTGPSDLSRLLVTQIPKSGYRIADGFHIYVTNGPTDRLHDLTEERIFNMAKLPWSKYGRPEAR
jgi:DNA polymerase/3'-5' exonuclease PolX